MLKKGPETARWVAASGCWAVWSGRKPHAWKEPLFGLLLETGTSELARVFGDQPSGPRRRRGGLCTYRIENLHVRDIVTRIQIDQQMMWVDAGPGRFTRHRYPDRLPAGAKAMHSQVERFA